MADIVPDYVVNFSEAINHMEIVPTYETAVQFFPRPYNEAIGGDLTMTIEEAQIRTTKIAGTRSLFVRFISIRGDLGFKAFPLEGWRKDGKPQVLGILDLLGASGLPMYDLLEIVHNEAGISTKFIREFLIGKQVGAACMVREYNEAKVLEILRFFRADWLKHAEIEQIVQEELARERSFVRAYLTEHGLIDVAMKLARNAHRSDLQSAGATAT